MALIKKINMDCKVDASYHACLSFVFDGNSKKASAIIGSFKDREARKVLNATPIEIQNFVGLQVKSISEMFEHIKTLPKFQGASDDI